MNVHLDRKDLLDSLRGLLKIKTVNSNAGAVTPEAPLGTGINDAINYVLDLGKRFGFKTKNCDGYCGYVEIGEGDEMVAVITHVDTVEIGDDWTVPPFDLTIDGDKVYGRGILDDKGPTMVSLFALKALKDSNTPINKRIRLIVGGDEEGGNWACMKHYKETEEIPKYAFSPDSSYPVIFAEKGIMNVIFEKELDSDLPVLEFIGGKQINSVPDYATATFEGQIYESKGKSAHASEPQKGDNAIIKQTRVLSEAGIKHPILDLLNRATPEGFGINLSDEISGKLILNPAIVKVDDKKAILQCDIRYPVTMNSSQICEAIKKAIHDFGFSLEMDHETLPLHVDRESFLVKSLQKVYADYTGDAKAPIVSGGGTYARAFDNAVAFGGVFPGEENTCHQTDEFWSIESIENNFDIIVKAMEVLAQ